MGVKTRNLHSDCFEARFFFKRRNTYVGSLLTASYRRIRADHSCRQNCTEMGRQGWIGCWDGQNVVLGRSLRFVGISANSQSWFAHLVVINCAESKCTWEKSFSIRPLSLSLIGRVALGECFNDSDHRLPQHRTVFIGLRVSQIILFLLMGRSIFNFYEANFSCLQSECLTVYGPCIIIATVTHLLASIQLHRLFEMMYNL